MECKGSKALSCPTAATYWNISRMECKALQVHLRCLHPNHWNISRMECKESSGFIDSIVAILLEYIQNGM